ncbi:MAG: hypothetical protein Kow0059_15160 [Candidatus Sumerlaeia bacterium]
MRKIMHRIRTLAVPGRAAACLVAVMLLLGTGCSWYRTNRCWISVDKYNIAKSIYLNLGSLDQTREQLRLSYWRPCEINQAIYWIQKDLHLDSAEDLE